MGVDEGSLTVKDVLAKLDELSPKVESILCVVVTKDSQMLMIKSPMTFAQKAMATSLINYEMNLTTGETIARKPKTGSDH